MPEAREKPLVAGNYAMAIKNGLAKPGKPQAYYNAIKQKFAEERDLRLGYRPEGRAQYTSELTGSFARYETDPYGGEIVSRDTINDTVECLFIGGGFAALLTAARLREYGVESIRIIERGADVGGTWYWNRYPGVACDVVAYDYLPLLDEMDYVPTRHYAKGPEILAYCQAIAGKYELYDLAVFQTTVTSTVWNAEEEMWHLTTDRGDHMRARFVICANGTLTKPKLSRIQGMESFRGHHFHTSRWDYAYTREDMSGLEDKVVGIIGTGASAVQAVPVLGASAKELYVFQRTPSSIEFRDDWPTDPNWARKLKPGWQAKRRQRAMGALRLTEEQKAERAALSRKERIRRQENANVDHMMRIHKHIDGVVKDKATADALKPWYMYFCKRPCIDNNYLPTFNRPNVHLVDTQGKGITEITAKGPAFGGTEYELDLLVYATGFEVAKTGTYNQIKGENGLELNDKYSTGIRTLLGIHTQGYPNLFIMGGQQASFQFNQTDILQCQGDHIAACIDYVRRHDHQSIDVTPEAEEWWVQEVIHHRARTTRNQDCTPGYYNFEGESLRRQDGTYNGGLPKYVAHLKDVQARMADNFVFTTR